jgi:hypothetical protein
MVWTRFLATVIAAGVVSSFTDFLFMGVLFHDKYNAHPEVWRSAKGEDKRAIMWGTALGFAVCAIFTFFCYRLNWQYYPLVVPLKLATAVWAMGPLPIVISNSIWMKLHPQIALAHALGWLAKFVVSALAVTTVWRVWPPS